MKVTQADHPPQYCFLQITWALISSVDIESERFRFLGSYSNLNMQSSQMNRARFTLGALKEIMSHKRYPGRLRFVAADNEDVDYDTDGVTTTQVCHT